MTELYVVVSSGNDDNFVVFLNSVIADKSADGGVVELNGVTCDKFLKHTFNMSTYLCDLCIYLRKM